MKTKKTPAVFLTAILISFIASVAQCTDRSDSKKQGTQIRVPAPLKKPWVVSFNDAGFRIIQNKVDEDGRASHFQGINANTRLSVTVFMEPGGAKTDTSKTVRDAYWGQTKTSYKVEDVKLWEQDDAACVAYTRIDIAGKPVRQRNLEAFYAHDGVWVDVKVSKLQFRDDDLPEMEAMLKSVSFQAAENAKNP